MCKWNRHTHCDSEIQLFIRSSFLFIKSFCICQPTEVDILANDTEIITYTSVTKISILVLYYSHLYAICELDFLLHPRTLATRLLGIPGPFLQFLLKNEKGEHVTL